MIRQLVKSRRKQILIDINTQRDLFLANGNACIRNHRRVLAHIRRMMAWARYRNVPIISTCEVYPNNNNNGGNAINYCIDGTNGQKKIPYTLLSDHATFPADNNTDLPANILRRYRQIVLHKRCFDPFDEPRIERLLTEIRASEFILIGACAEGAVSAMALGLLQRGKKVTIVTDAVGVHNKGKSQLALRKAEAKGARLVETKRIAGTSHLRRVGICHCQSCNGKAKKPPAEIKTEQQ
jgi:nicotinamidase-related amidase